MESRSKSFYLLVSGLCLCASAATAQSNSIDPRTVLPAACIAPSELTGGLDFTPDSSYLRLNNAGNEAYAAIDGERMKLSLIHISEPTRPY